MPYGWCKNNNLREKIYLDVFQKRIMRICTNKKKIDRILINTILMMTRLTPVSILVKRKKTNMIRASKKK